MVSVFPKNDLYGIVCHMIPAFPEFKKLELEDKETIEQFTNDFQPYSDFDFVSMYTWNIEGKIFVSELNNNLVVQFADYLTGEPFFSFIGKNLPNETAKTLLDFSVQKDILHRLKLIPQDIADLLDKNTFSIVEDRDSFDYIYDTAEHSSFSGGNYANKRKEVNAVLRTNPDIEAHTIDDSVIQETMIALYDKWAGNKLTEEKLLEKNEGVSFKSLINILKSCDSKLSGIGVFSDKQLIAFCIYELMANDFAVGHTAKSDNSIKGSNAFLMKALGESLFKAGKKYFNYEQDLGLENLRTAKERFRPVFYLKKYIVELK